MITEVANLFVIINLMKLHFLHQAVWKVSLIHNKISRMSATNICFLLQLDCAVNNQRYQGSVMKRLDTHSRAGCYQTCRATKGCKYWSVMYGEGCTLMSSFTGQKSQDAMTSGRICSKREERDFLAGVWRYWTCRNMYSSDDACWKNKIHHSIFFLLLHSAVCKTTSRTVCFRNGFSACLSIKARFFT